MAKELEQDIQRACLQLLTLRKDLGFFWRNNSTGVYDPTRKVFRKPRGVGMINGTADILGITTKGRFVAFEVKTPKGKLTLDQADFLSRINENGGYAKVVHSLDELIVVLEGL